MPPLHGKKKGHGGPTDVTDAALLTGLYMTKMLTDEQEQLFLDNMRLVYYHANRRVSQASPHYEDAVQEALIDMARAVQTWEPNRGTKFGSYASHSIIGAVLDTRDYGVRKLTHSGWYATMAPIQAVMDGENEGFEAQEPADSMDWNDVDWELDHDWRMTKILTWAKDLPPMDRDIVLGILDGKTGMQIAQEMGRKRQTIYWHIAKIRDSFPEELRNEIRRP